MIENPNVANTETTNVAPADFEALFTEEQLEAIMSPEDAAEALNAGEPLSDWFTPGATDETRRRADDWADALNIDGWSAAHQSRVAQHLLDLMVEMKAEDLKDISDMIEVPSATYGKYIVIAMQFTDTTLSVVLEGPEELDPVWVVAMAESIEAELERNRRAPGLEVEIKRVATLWAIERPVENAGFTVEGVVYDGNDVIVNVIADGVPSGHAPALDEVRDELEAVIARIVRVEGHIATPQVVVIGSYENMSSDLFWGGTPADWLVATGSGDPFKATQEWAFNHAASRASTGEPAPDQHNVELALELLENLKAKAIAGVTDWIRTVISNKGFRLAALQFTDKAVTVTLDGADKVALTREVYAEIVEAIEMSLMHNGATRLNIEIASVVTDFGRASLGYYEAI